jgi:hypothetical protein
MQYVKTPSHIPPPETAKLKKAADVSENTGIRREIQGFDTVEHEKNRYKSNYCTCALKSY